MTIILQMHHFAGLICLRSKQFIVTILLLTLTNFSLASVAELTTHLLQIEKQQLANHPGWLSLLHFRKPGENIPPISEADNATFFISPNGKHNSRAELIQSVQAMLASTPANDNHFQCRYPARTSWLTTQLNINKKELPKIKCSSLEKWKQAMNVDRAILVFPSSYLGAASSMFGHLFLRFENSQKPDRLNSATFNYAAVTSSEDGSHSITGGLFTGLPSDFSIKPYYLKLKEYAYMESRDIWEYDLALTQSEIDFLILHLWELRSNTFDYFFLDENCAYRILSVIEAAKATINLTKYFQTTALPSEIIAALNKANLIKEAHFIPSSYRLFLHKTGSLTKREKKIIKQLALGQITATTKYFASINDNRKFHLLGLAIEYLNFIISADFYNRGLTRTRLHSLIVARAKITTTKHPKEEKIAPPPRPERGHGMSKISLQRISIDDKLYSSIKFRYAYHNLLDPITGFTPGSQIEALTFSFNIENNLPELQQFNLLHISSLMPVSYFFSPVSWHFSTGILRQDLNKNKPGSFARILMGKTYATKSVYAYGLLGLSTLYGTHLPHNNSTGPQLELGILYYLTSQTGYLKYIASSYMTGHEFDSQNIEFTHSVSIGKDISVDFQLLNKHIEEKESRQTSIQFNLYF